MNAQEQYKRACSAIRYIERFEYNVNLYYEFDLNRRGSLELDSLPNAIVGAAYKTTADDLQWIARRDKLDRAPGYYLRTRLHYAA